MRSMVEGVCHTHHDQIQNRFHVLHHVARSNPSDAVSMLMHVVITMQIPLRLLAEIMRASIHLNDELRLSNIEIRNVGSNRVLTAHLEA
jgi:hypothetical protein